VNDVKFNERDEKGYRVPSLRGQCGKGREGETEYLDPGGTMMRGTGPGMKSNDYPAN